MFEKVLSFLLLIVACNAQIPYLGTCPAVNVKQDFVPALYLGKWYEQEKYFATFEFPGKCVTATYTSLPSGLIGVTNTQTNCITNAVKSISGTASLVGAPNDARLSVVLDGVPMAAPYWVLDTDYTNYAVVYACSNYVFFNLRFLWILTRASNPSASVLNSAYSVMDRNSLSKSILLKTNKSNCPASY